ncbi:MAG: TVP38/TMEM64 family protein [Acetobacterales bacterium]
MDRDEPPPKGQGRTRPHYGRVILVLILVAAFATAYAAGLQDYVSLETLRTHRQTLRAAVSENLLLALGGYIGAYALVTAFSVPGGLFMTIAGGFLFGLWLGTLGAVTGATAGAIVVFLVARHALYDLMRARAGNAARRMEAGFREDALSYMFVLRLVPLFPFWLVNIVPALLGVTLRTYVVGTFFGIMPGAFVYAWVGTGLDEVFARGGKVDTGIIFAPEVLGPILGLAALALVPIVYKRLRRRGHTPVA